MAVAGGRAVKTTGGWVIRYFTADHLGSTRLVTDASGSVVEQFDYLPYGEKCINSGLSVANSNKTEYLYGGKELPQLFGIDWYNSGSSTYASSTQKYIYTGGLLNEFVCGSLLSSDSSVLVENEPDVFHFSFPGHSGSFILQPDHTVRFLNCSTPSGELSAEMAAGTASIIGGFAMVSAAPPLAAALGGASIASGLTSLGAGMSLDVVTGNDHKAFESSFSLIDLGVNVASLQLSSTYNIADALQLLNSIRESYSNVKESVESKLKEPIEYSNDEYEVDSH